MNDKELPKIIEQMTADIKALKQGKGSTPFHFHNGIDAPQLPIRSISGTRVAQASYNPGNLVDGDGVTTTVALQGAAVGDWVLASFSLDLQGIILTGYVSAPNVVSVRFQNETGGAIDLAAGTLFVLLFRHI